MAKNEKIFLTNSAKVASVTIADTDTTTLKTLYTAPADGARIMWINIKSDDTADKDVVLVINDGTNDHEFHHIDVPASAGTNGTVNSVDGLNVTNAPGIPKDANGNKFINLGASYVVKVRALATLTTGKVITVSIYAEEYTA